jgi:hypothetical protein
VVLIFIGERLQEELFQVLFQRCVDEHLDRIFVLFRCDLSNGTMWRIRLVQDKQPLEICSACFGTNPAAAITRCFMDSFNQLTADLGIA